MVLGAAHAIMKSSDYKFYGFLLQTCATQAAAVPRGTAVTLPKKTHTNCLNTLRLAFHSWQALGFHYNNCKKTLFGVHAQVSYIYIYILV